MRRGVIAAALAVAGLAAPAAAQNSCAAGRTLEDGVLTVATGNPAFPPWVLDDDPSSGKGFEAAVAYAVAAEMGFERDQVRWVRASFDQSIQPGAKNFDFNVQQFSITPEREKVVDFSKPYYSAAMAVLSRTQVVEAEGIEPTVASMRDLQWGAVGTTTALPVLTGLIEPERQPRLYGDNADLTAAMQAGQVDAAMFDLPTALYLSAVTLDDGVILGQFPADRTENPDRFGLLMEEDNPLKECTDAAIEALSADGTLAGIEARWLSEATGVPVIGE